MSEHDSTLPYAVVIEDDIDIRGLHHDVLAQSGFEPILTSNGVDGLRAVRKYDPVVTLVDVSMQGMDGLAAARRIREFSDTYILMVSALSDEIDIIDGLAAGADDYLAKPFRPRVLRARIQALLRRPRGVGEPAVAAAAQLPAPAPAPAPEPVAVQEHLGRFDPTRHVTALVGTPGSPAIRTIEGLLLADEGLVQPPTPVAVNLGSPAPVFVHQQTATPPPAAAPSTPAPSSPAPSPAASAPAGAPAATDVVDERVDEGVDEAPVGAEAPQSGSTVSPDDGEITHFGTLSLNPATGAVSVEGREVDLNASEFALLSTLVESGTRIRSTANLVLTLRDEGYVTTYYISESDKRAVKAHMSSLLRKLGDTGVTPKWIENVRGVGYRMCHN